MDAETNRAMCEIFLKSILFGAVPAWIAAGLISIWWRRRG